MQSMVMQTNRSGSICQDDLTTHLLSQIVEIETEQKCLLSKDSAR
jgi:hypothetical protein